MATNPKEFRVKNGLEITAGPIKINGSAGTSGQVISSTGTGVEWVQATAGSGSVTSITAGTGLSGGVITTSGTIAIDSTVATLTGTQTLTNKTLTSPTFTAPVLGTPASGTLTNCTFPTLNQNTTGSAGSVANTLTISSPLSGTSYNGSSAVSIGIPVATTSANGYLSSTDWTTFNNKGSGTVTSVTGTSPVVSSGGATPAISMPVATTSVSGYLSSTDWTTFNNKTSNTGTVTSVSGAGTVSGITLTGTVTGSGSLTLGGTIATLNQNTTGSAGSVTGLTINNSSSAIDPNSVTQNQIGYANSVSLFGQTDGGLYSSAYNSSWIHEIFGDFRTGQIAIRGKNSGTFTAWRTVLDSTNYTSYSPTLTGTGASGTWGISITGSAGSVPASGLTGATLASGVTASSLTSVGTLTGLSVSGANVLVSAGYGIAYSADQTRIMTPEDSVSGALIRWGSGGVCRFLNGSTESMRLNSTGLGIGTASPSYKLDVTGTLRVTDRIHSNEWIQFTNTTGLYSPTNGAHFLPNVSSYGSWKVLGSRNGWCGLEFETSSNGNVSLMINQNGGTSGFHNNSVGWQMRWNAGTIYCNKGSHGAGTEATVLDSSNYSSYALPNNGSWLGDLGSYGYARQYGFEMTGGSAVSFLYKSGQGSILVDGNFIAFEGGGFYSSSNSSGGTMLGMKTIATNTLEFNAKASYRRSIQSSGGDDFYIELTAPNPGNTGGDIGLRFHSEAQWWRQIRANVGGFRFTQGSDNNTVPITASNITAEATVTATSDVVHYGDRRIPRTFVLSTTPTGTISDGDVWLQY